MPVVYGDQVPFRQTAPGALRQFLANRATGATAMSVAPSEWQPGTGPEPHEHPVEEIFVFLDGYAEGGIGDESVQIRPGAVVIIPPRTTHWFRVLGPGPTRQIAIWASPDYTGPGEPPSPPVEGFPIVEDSSRPLVCVPSADR